MCGFLAVLQGAPTVDVRRARSALDAIAHRGPDAAGEWCEGDVFLGHRRLSIIDLATGDQPMHSVDGRYVIVFNGEIYNFRELGKRLTDEGGILRTQSDTEVILEGYRHWGPRVVQLLNGMFAFVIWDRQARSVFAARDRLGIKPLCWAMHRGALVVSSTLEPFTALNGFGRIDLVAVRDLMTFDYIPTPRTIFGGVQKLDPGSRFEWSLGADSPQDRTILVPSANECNSVGSGRVGIGIPARPGRQTTDDQRRPAGRVLVWRYRFVAVDSPYGSTQQSAATHVLRGIRRSRAR